MPFLERAGHPPIHYVLDDFTDPWKKAPVLLLQHGYSRSTRIWYAWIPYLARHFRILRTDLRGLGQSRVTGDLDSLITTEAWLDDLLAVIDHVGGPVHYCGESLGGILGMLLAASHPEAIRTLSIVSAPLRISARTRADFACGHASWPEAIRQMGSQKWSAAVNGITRFPPGTDPALLDWYAEETGKSDAAAMARIAEIACEVDIESCLPDIQAPVLGLYPRQGKLTGGDDEIIERRIRDVRIVRMPTPFHAIQFMMPAACATEVLHFAAQFDGTSCHE